MNVSKPAKPDAARPGATPRPRVLIVDDDPITAESLADYLSEEGYDTATAFNGSEAAAHCRGGTTRRRGRAPGPLRWSSAMSRCP